MELQLEKQLENVEKLRKIQQKLLELSEMDSGCEESFTAKVEIMLRDVKMRILQIDRAVEHDYSEADKLRYTQMYLLNLRAPYVGGGRGRDNNTPLIHRSMPELR
jgi:hypothetical protein